MADTAAKTAKTAADQAAAFGKQAFKDTVETSMNSFAELGAVSKRNIEALTDSFNAASQGAQALGAQAVAYSKKSFEDQVVVAKSLAAAKSVQEVVELQTAWAKSALETYMAQVGKMSETVAASVKDSMKPLNERVTAMVERLQAAR